jgi:hypothetical protein
VTSVDVEDSADEGQVPAAQQQQQRHKAASRKGRSMADWGKAGFFPVAPPELGELKQQSIDW